MLIYSDVITNNPSNPPQKKQKKTKKNTKFGHARLNAFKFCAPHRSNGGQQNMAKMEFDIDPLYECDAPTYVDFNELAQDGKPDDDDADAWFGEKLSPYFVCV